MAKIKSIGRRGLYKPKTTGDLQTYSRIKKKKAEESNKLLKELTRSDFSKLKHKLKSLSDEYSWKTFELNAIVHEEICKLRKRKQKEIESAEWNAIVQKEICKFKRRKQKET